MYVAIAREILNRRSVLQKNHVLKGQLSASNPLLHIHANRYEKNKSTATNNALMLASQRAAA